MAIYRSAWRLIRGLQKCWNSVPQAFLATNISWSHGLSAAVSADRWRYDVIFVDLYFILFLDCDVLDSNPGSHFKHGSISISRVGRPLEIISRRCTCLSSGNQVACRFYVGFSMLRTNFLFFRIRSISFIAKLTNCSIKLLNQQLLVPRSSIAWVVRHIFWSTRAFRIVVLPILVNAHR